MRWMLLTLLAACSNAAAASVTFDVCVGPVRIERVDPQTVAVFCMSKTTPVLTISPCPQPAQIETRGDDRVIHCRGWMTIKVGAQ